MEKSITYHTLIDCCRRNLPHIDIVRRSRRRSYRYRAVPQNKIPTVGPSELHDIIIGPYRGIYDLTGVRY